MNQRIAAKTSSSAFSFASATPMKVGNPSIANAFRHAPLVVFVSGSRVRKTIFFGGTRSWAVATPANANHVLRIMARAPSSPRRLPLPRAGEQEPVARVAACGSVHASRTAAMVRRPRSQARSGPHAARARACSVHAACAEILPFLASCKTLEFKAGSNWSWLYATSAAFCTGAHCARPPRLASNAAAT